MELKRYKKRASKKGIKFKLTEKWLLEELKIGKCAVTGIPFKLKPKNSTLNSYLPSIDRIDSNKGYTEDNCQLVIIGYNNLKSDNDIDTVTLFCKNFVKKYKEEQNK